MAGSKRDAASTVRSFIARTKKRSKGIELDTSLYAEGIGLDSLEVAELSAVLEDELGSDPFSNGQMPETVGEIVAFYDDKPATSP
ncbi:MAG TPA: acyl carrier protein [Acidimicrobiales bacterium]|jgi:acyl carrier protein|nr:acyl carrier protein [Acidimicrobiales bacterium]